MKFWDLLLQVLLRNDEDIYNVACDAAALIEQGKKE
jgi:hypothetical protein